jgi:hypothetical protein
MNRRTFLKKTSCCALAGNLVFRAIPGHAKPRCKRLSANGKHHFFGYYGINPWDRSKRYHLALETDFDDRVPTAADWALVGLIDSRGHRFIPFAKTTAFNLQQGSMMHWIDSGFGEEFVYNAYENQSLLSYTINIKTGAKRKINSAVAAVSPNGREAIGLNYIRSWYCRNEVGYANDIPNYETTNVPEKDGLFAVDLVSGEKRLLLPFAEVVKHPAFHFAINGLLWFDHVLYNPSGKRMLFFCRIKTGKNWASSLWTVNRDGTNLQCQIPFGHWISHFDWKDDRTILITSDVLGEKNFLEFTDGHKDFMPMGKGILPADGHCSYSPDGRYILCDAKVAGGDHPKAEIFLFNLAKGEKRTLGVFDQDVKRSGAIRCDLHPRFSLDGKTITFDSVHEGERQIYRIEL